MEKEAFQRELAKYKIVRLEDYCRSRDKRMIESRPAAARNAPVHPEKVHVRLTNTDAESRGFWELMEVASRELLTVEETARFMAALRQSYKEVPDSINLEDLNYAASLV